MTNEILYILKKRKEWMNPTEISMFVDLPLARIRIHLNKLYDDELILRRLRKNIGRYKYYEYFAK